jgi:hypothetical protein
MNKNETQTLGMIDHLVIVVCASKGWIYLHRLAFKM